MRSRCAVLLMFLAVSSTQASTQINLSELLKKIPNSGVTEKDASLGVKEALTQGITRAVLNLNKTDGFFGSDIYKMLLPPDAKKIETTLRKMGMGSQVDKAILAI